MGWYNEKKEENDISGCRRRIYAFFSFDLKEVIEDECLTLTRREFQVIGSTYLKGSLPQGSVRNVRVMIRGSAKRSEKES